MGSNVGKVVVLLRQLEFLVESVVIVVEHVALYGTVSFFGRTRAAAQFRARSLIAHAKLPFCSIGYKRYEWRFKLASRIVALAIHCLLLHVALDEGEIRGLFWMCFGGGCDGWLLFFAITAVDLFAGLDGDSKVGSAPLTLHLHHLSMIGRSA